MKMTLKPIQGRILVKLGTAGQLSLNRLVEVSMPSRNLMPDQRARWDNEIRLQIELLGLYGMIQIVEQLGVRMCIAPEFVVRWVPVHIEKSKTKVKGKKYTPSIILPLLAGAVLATATTGCSTFPGMKQDTPAPVVSRYNAEGTAPPDRMEQFYNAKTGNMVYRFCVGNECPEPTPKKPVRQMAVVTEVSPDGNLFPKDAPPASALPSARVLETTGKVVTPLAPKTAANNPAAAAIAAQLNDQRRAVQAAAGVEQSPANPVPAPKLSVRSMGGGGPTAKPVPTPVPQATTGSQQGGGIVPTTGSRVPSGPQAKASVLNGPALASVKASAAPVGSNAAPVMVTETQVKTSAASTNASTITTGSAEEFLSGWASLWSEKNADTYFGLYAQDFWPTYGETKTRPATPVEQRRTSRMPSNIEAVKPAVGGWPQP